MRTPNSHTCWIGCTSNVKKLATLQAKKIPDRLAVGTLPEQMVLMSIRISMSPFRRLLHRLAGSQTLRARRRRRLAPALRRPRRAQSGEALRQQAKLPAVDHLAVGARLEQAALASTKISTRPFHPLRPPGLSRTPPQPAPRRLHRRPRSRTSRRSKLRAISREPVRPPLNPQRKLRWWDPLRTQTNPTACSTRGITTKVSRWD